MSLIQVMAVGLVIGFRLFQAQVEFPPDVRKALEPVKGAESVKWSDTGVSYDVQVDYPALAFVTGLDVMLTRMGWTALAEDIFSPGLPTSNGNQWSNFIDGRSQPNRRVYQWLGEWTNSRGDVIAYGLTYRADSAAPDAAPNNTLHVGARFFSAAELRRQGLKVTKPKR